jgi:regulator of protease activity HflC (stomatin/prohibitin superfamily)
MLAPEQSEMTLASAPSGVAARQALDQDHLMQLQEQSPAYRALHDNHLISTQYRVRRADDLDTIRSNTSQAESSTLQAATCNGCCCLINFFVVNAGCIRKGAHKDGSYFFFGEGVHVIKSPFVSVVGASIPLTTPAIVHGPRAILTVDQGFVGLAMDRGQPVLLPPGLHQWNSSTIKWEGLIDLSTSIIRLGPYSLVTVDEGYAAVTQDNGQQKILEGGSAYMLTHRNWKFEKFITQKLQTNDVGPMVVTTGDNVPLETTATVNWRIEDVTLAARMAANTMPGNFINQANQQASNNQFDISKLRQDVLRQVTASLAAFVGSVSYSAHGHAAMADSVAGGRKNSAEPEPEEKEGAKALFDREKLMSSVDHANNICGQYGVKVLSINLISAYPKDPSLLEALSQGAVATVAAEQIETAARGEAKAVKLRAQAESDAERIRAEGHAAAEAIKAEGSLKAANSLEGSEVATTIAKLRAAGVALGEGKANSFFFGLGGPAEIPTGLLGSALMADAATARRD